MSPDRDLDLAGIVGGSHYEGGLCPLAQTYKRNFFLYDLLPLIGRLWRPFTARPLVSVHTMFAYDSLLARLGRTRSNNTTHQISINFALRRGDVDVCVCYQGYARLSGAW